MVGLCNIKNKSYILSYVISLNYNSMNTYSSNPQWPSARTSLNLLLWCVTIVKFHTMYHLLFHIFHFSGETTMK